MYNASDFGFSIAGQLPGAESPLLSATDLKVGQWVCLQDEYNDGPGAFVKIVSLDVDGNSVSLQHEDSMDRWGGKIDGEVEEVTLPIFGWVQK